MDNVQQSNNKKTTPAQFSVLVEEMENNPNIGQPNPIFGYTRTKRETFWNSLAFRLNSLGPKQRTTSEWKKVWSELKLRTKRKIAVADSENGTGSISESSYDGHIHDQALHVRNDTLSGNRSSAHEAPSTSNRANPPDLASFPRTSSTSRIFVGQTKTKNVCDSMELLGRQVENEVNMIAALNRANELKQQQLKLMEEQNKLISATIECVNNLSVKFIDFVENNNK